jgi:hypothetical protein
MNFARAPHRKKFRTQAKFQEISIPFLTTDARTAGNPSRSVTLGLNESESESGYAAHCGVPGSVPAQVT